MEALASGGLFRLFGMLIGAVAFQTYAGLLGVRLQAAAILTGDADVAQDNAVSREVEDTRPPIVDLLQNVDPSFPPVPHRLGSIASSAFQKATGYRVEFLTSNRGSDDYIDRPASMPALGGASADPLRFLDFLIRDPLRTILLHKSGIPVTVPDPARYAVHKMIVATRRRADGLGAVKRDKDIRQAEIFLKLFMRPAERPISRLRSRKRGNVGQRGKRLFRRLQTVCCLRKAKMRLTGSGDKVTPRSVQIRRRAFLRARRSRQRVYESKIAHRLQVLKDTVSFTPVQLPSRALEVCFPRQLKHRPPVRTKCVKTAYLSICKASLKAVVAGWESITHLAMRGNWVSFPSKCLHSEIHSISRVL
ncbi:nucleotidyltransferase-like protein [Neorhizobium sp. JUb45]|nr:nucleotidyltransferase-like protein [Neorhizobium sp. JUb45]